MTGHLTLLSWTWVNKGSLHLKRKPGATFLICEQKISQCQFIPAIFNWSRQAYMEYMGSSPFVRLKFYFVLSGNSRDSCTSHSKTLMSRFERQGDSISFTTRKLSLLLQIHLPFLTFSMYSGQLKPSQTLFRWLFGIQIPYKESWQKNWMWDESPEGSPETECDLPRNGVTVRHETEQRAQMAGNMSVWHLFRAIPTSIQPQDFIHSWNNCSLTAYSVPDTWNRRSKRQFSSS